MTGPVRAELLKLRTLRLTWVVSAVALVMATLVSAVAAAAARREPVRAAELLTAPAQTLFFLVIVLAVVASAGEFQHRTIRTTLLALPRRSTVLAAKAAAAAMLGAALVGVCALLALAAGVTARAVADVPAPTWGADALGVWLGSVALGAMWAVIAVAIGLLTRSVAVGLVAVLLWRFVGEGIVPVVTRRPELSRWTPSGAGDAVLGLGGDRLPVTVALLVVLGYVAVVVGAAVAVFLARDPV